MWYLYACTRVWINLSFFIKGKVNSERKWYYSLLMSIESNDKKDPNRKMLFVLLICAHQWKKSLKKWRSRWPIISLFFICLCCEVLVIFFQFFTNINTQWIKINVCKLYCWQSHLCYPNLILLTSFSTNNDRLRDHSFTQRFKRYNMHGYSIHRKKTHISDFTDFEWNSTFSDRSGIEMSWMVDTFQWQFS